MSSSDDFDGNIAKREISDTPTVDQDGVVVESKASGNSDLHNLGTRAEKYQSASGIRGDKLLDLNGQIAERNGYLRALDGIARQRKRIIVQAVSPHLNEITDALKGAYTRINQLERSNRRLGILGGIWAGVTIAAGALYGLVSWGEGFYHTNIKGERAKVTLEIDEKVGKMRGELFEACQRAFESYEQRIGNYEQRIRDLELGTADEAQRTSERVDDLGKKIDGLKSRVSDRISAIVYDIDTVVDGINARVDRTERNYASLESKLTQDAKKLRDELTDAAVRIAAVTSTTSAQMDAYTQMEVYTLSRSIRETKRHANVIDQLTHDTVFRTESLFSEEYEAIIAHRTNLDQRAAQLFKGSALIGYAQVMRKAEESLRGNPFDPETYEGINKIMRDFTRANMTTDATALEAQALLMQAYVFRKQMDKRYGPK